MIDIQRIEERVRKDGFALARGVLNGDQVEELLTTLEPADVSPWTRRNGGIRNLFRVLPAARELADLPTVRKLVEPVLGSQAFPVRAILFDKTPDSNWKVPWHQDVTIAVANRVESEGFGPWSMKTGVHHVQPPAAILDAMLSVRFHLDPCGAENGALKVLPCSHLLGRLPEEEAARMGAEQPSTVCEANRGDALLMKPLLVHASSSSTNPHHRRVIHIDFAATQLPEGMGWYDERAAFVV
jgi:ectoine hydroxylase-related dioxygenase (phytanoyl-CoA dioxygenase family)